MTTHTEIGLTPSAEGAGSERALTDCFTDMMSSQDRDADADRLRQLIDS